MDEFLDLFSQADSVDYSSFTPTFDFAAFDSGLTAADFGANSDFDLGGIGDGGLTVDPTPVDIGAFDGSYDDALNKFYESSQMEVASPTDFGVFWEPDMSFSADGLNLPNVDARTVIDVAKGGTSVYTATQSGARNNVTRPSTQPSGASTNGDAFRSIIGNITKTISAGAAAVANYEDTKARVSNKTSGLINRGASSGILGPRTGVVQGSGVRRTGADTGIGSGITASPLMLAALGVLGFVALRKG